MQHLLLCKGQGGCGKRATVHHKRRVLELINQSLDLLQPKSRRAPGCAKRGKQSHCPWQQSIELPKARTQRPGLPCLRKQREKTGSFSLTKVVARLDPLTTHRWTPVEKGTLGFLPVQTLRKKDVFLSRGVEVIPVPLF